jgi:hypothetical protein
MFNKDFFRDLNPVTYGNHGYIINEDNDKTYLTGDSKQELLDIVSDILINRQMDYRAGIHKGGHTIWNEKEVFIQISFEANIKKRA